MKLHLIDGTYELFRNYFGAPPKVTRDGRQVGATLGLLRSMLMLVTSPGVTHVGVAFDHVIESFRNDLHPGYKTSAGVDGQLLAQFPLAEEALSALGLVVWPMVEFEADDAIASAVARFSPDRSIKQIVVGSPDKDLAQLVRAKRVVCWDRRRDFIISEKEVIAKYGVHPQSIPDWLALVGDSVDGYPGIKGWGAKTASTVLAKFRHVESIPLDPDKWRLASIGEGRAASLAASLANGQDDLKLYKKLAVLRTDAPLKETLPDLEWRGAHPRLRTLCRDLGDERILERIPRWRTE
jgi:5'-3' exonuclease